MSIRIRTALGLTIVPAAALFLVNVPAVSAEDQPWAPMTAPYNSGQSGSGITLWEPGTGVPDYNAYGSWNGYNVDRSDRMSSSVGSVSQPRRVQHASTNGGITLRERGAGVPDYHVFGAWNGYNVDSDRTPSPSVGSVSHPRRVRHSSNHGRKHLARSRPQVGFD